MIAGKPCLSRRPTQRLKAGMSATAKLSIAMFAGARMDVVLLVIALVVIP